MALKHPTNTDDCVYFTRRSVDDGRIMAWVLRNPCPKCGKSLMGKPKDKSGKVLIRAKEYVCPSCGYKAEKQAYEDTLTANIEYTCHSCNYSGELQIPFRRKKVQGVDTLRFQCQKCRANIDVTKKMREIRKKEGDFGK